MGIVAMSFRNRSKWRVEGKVMRTHGMHLRWWPHRGGHTNLRIANYKLRKRERGVNERVLTMEQINAERVAGAVVVVVVICGRKDGIEVEVGEGRGVGGRQVVQIEKDECVKEKWFRAKLLLVS